MVEILVVVVIMAIVISLAILSIGVTGRDAGLDEESRRIEGLLGFLHERALLEGRDFGLRIGPSDYEFAVYDGIRDRWFPMQDEHEYRRRELPKGLTFLLELDSQQVVLKPIDNAGSTDSPPPAPQIAVAASGEGTPFRLTLVRDATQAKAAVCGDSLGRINSTNSSHQTGPGERPGYEGASSAFAHPGSGAPAQPSKCL